MNQKYKITLTALFVLAAILLTAFSGPRPNPPACDGVSMMLVAHDHQLDGRDLWMWQVESGEYAVSDVSIEIPARYDVSCSWCDIWLYGDRQIITWSEFNLAPHSSAGYYIRTDRGDGWGYEAAALRSGNQRCDFIVAGPK